MHTGTALLLELLRVGPDSDRDAPSIHWMSRASIGLPHCVFVCVHGCSVDYGAGACFDGNTQATTIGYVCGTSNIAGGVMATMQFTLDQNYADIVGK